MKSLSDTDEHPSPHAADTGDPLRKAGFLGLTIGAVGVVFGDIGTSPLYAMREAMHHSRAGTAPELAAFGVISLVFWALLLLVTVKYVIFLMRADNQGEGGSLVLMGLAQKALSRPSQIIFLLGLCGAALFYGDSLITPAVSVLGALEGLKDAPGIAGSLDDYIVPLSLVILLGLFLVQSKGTEKVARFFGPVMLVWFAALAGLGLYWIVQRPEILQALSPHYGWNFLMANGLTGFVVLGSVFLVITGAEALYADMGHFGRGPIGAAWLWVAFPGLILNYLGQGALTLIDPTAAANPFWRMVPELAYWPMLLLACAATVIASQAVISGAFSMTQHAVQMGILPRMVIRRTSETQEGQIYVPQMNWLLMIGVVVLIVTFQNSSNLTSAYGIAVTGTMLISSIMAYIVMRRLWQWSRLKVLALLVPLGALEVVFLTSNLTKLFSGAWMPLLLGAVLILIMLTWAKGSRIIATKTHRESLAMTEVATMLEARPPLRVQGTAIFLTADASVAPTSLMHNLKHNRVLHENNVILSVQIRSVPHVADEDRIAIARINDDFVRVTLSFGFMDMPNVPRALALCRKRGLKFDAMTTTFFVGRRTLVATPGGGMPLWQDLLFIILMKNSADPSEFFRLPPGRVVEMGTQMRV